MSTSHLEVLPLIDHEPDTDSLREDVVAGLSQEQKEIPSKYLYDRRGSELFDAICELDEYYPTRTEMSIMEADVDAMTEAIGAGARLVEYGSGSSWKTRILLDHLDAPTQYVPIDISREHLLNAAQELADLYPHVPVQPVCADYTDDFDLPDAPRGTVRTVVYYPGSTIGNFRPSDAEPFLSHIARQAEAGGGLLIGVDLRKDPDILRAAYNDGDGVTAKFNLNLLRRLNRELDADFDLEAFAHEAVWNDAESCIEMHLVSQTDQTVSVAGETVAFDDGETIRTEYSYKYTLDGFASMAQSAGFSVDAVWTDDDDLFSVQYCSVEG